MVISAQFLWNLLFCVCESDWPVTHFQHFQLVLVSVHVTRVCLLLQVSDWLSVASLNCVLGDDGSEVTTEKFFQTLPDNTVLMVLEKDQKWTPHLV